MTFLVAIWAQLRRLPPWVWMAFFLVGSAWLYGNYRYNAGQADIQAKWDESLERGRQEMARLDASYRAQEQRHAADMDRIGREHEEAMKDAQATTDRLVSDLRAGNVRLRDQWRGCPAAQVPGAVANPGQSDGQDRLREASAGRIIGAVTACQAERDALLKIAESDRRKP